MWVNAHIGTKTRNFLAENLGPIEMTNLLEKKIPREGTKLREVYDTFQRNKGVPLDWSSTQYSGMYQLTDFYGLDIIRLKKNTWLLAGEWFGRVYVDYVSDRISEKV